MIFLTLLNIFVHNPATNTTPKAIQIDSIENGTILYIPNTNTTNVTVAIPTALLNKYPRSNQVENNCIVKGNAATPTRSSVIQNWRTIQKSASIESLYRTVRNESIMIYNPNMDIAIIGGGITGLTAAYELGKCGHIVTIFEREAYLGGLAYGFKQKNWDWHLEGAYHHMFTNDDAIITIAHELGIGDKLIYKRPVTANLLPGGVMAQLDSPFNLLRFPGLSPADKIRTGLLAAFCKAYPFWQTLEGTTAKQFFTLVGGLAGWRTIWEPLMTGKFGPYADTIAASWLWARIHKRTPTLIYIEGGFQTLVNALAEAIGKQGGTIKLNTSVKTLDSSFDKTLITTPTPIANILVPGIASKESLTIPHLHAQVLILETQNPVLDATYWLSVTDRAFPFLAVVAHTNYMDSSHYGGNHITYIGNYLPDGHKYLKMNKAQLLKEFLPYIQQIGNCLPAGEAGKLKIENCFLFTAPYAQPVHQIHYSKKAPRLETQIPGVFLANMDSIYPWDRGTNYAVELGQRAAAAMQV